VERIAAVEKLPERFVYPPGYSPQKYTEGSFGIIDGPSTDVELLLLNPETVAYLMSRRLHRTQRFHKRRDGKTMLTMTVRGTTELVSWILSLGPYVKVVRPAALRDEVKACLRQARELYGSG
jgi:predicted DNA-binding transcriptional regulator YafY